MQQLSQVPVVQLDGGSSIPQLGVGVWQVPDDTAQWVVETAIGIGYRHVDTARIYDNERGVGRGVRASGVPREELFVTTKLWNDDQGREPTIAAFERSLKRLDMEYVDLYLIHWPSPVRGEQYLDSWHAFAELRASGRVRAIGVSNFTEHNLERAVELTGVTPAINQVELHPYFQQRELRAAHERLGVVTESWSPLGQGGELLEDATIAGIADAHGATPAQVVIRWHLQHGFVVIPKSQHEQRLAQNFDVFGFELSDEDMAAIDDLDRGAAGRIGPDPAEATF